MPIVPCMRAGSLSHKVSPFSCRFISLFSGIALKTSKMNMGQNVQTVHQQACITRKKNSRDINKL